MKNSLTLGAGVIVILSVAVWFFILQPDQRDDVARAEESLRTGIEFFEERKFEEALAALQTVPSGGPLEAKARYYMGSSFMMLKDYESAADELELSLVLSSDDERTRYALGVVYFKLGNVKLAKSYFASVLEINPNDEQAKGLMDMMTRLERQSVAESEGGQGTDN